MEHETKVEWGKRLFSLSGEGNLNEAFLHFCSNPRYSREGRSWTYYFVEIMEANLRDERIIALLEIVSEYVDSDDICLAITALRIINHALRNDFPLNSEVVDRVYHRLDREISGEGEPSCNLVVLGIATLALWGSEESLDRAADLTISYGQRTFKISRAAWAKAFEPRKGWLRRRRIHVLNVLATTGVNPVWALMEDHFRRTGGREPFVVPELPK